MKTKFKVFILSVATLLLLSCGGGGSGGNSDGDGNDEKISGFSLPSNVEIIKK